MPTQKLYGKGWRWITQDTLINEGETLLHKLMVNASVSGGDVTLYEGLDASSGRMIGIFTALANSVVTLNFDGLYLDRGLFVDIGSNINGVLVVYDTLRNENPNIEA